MNRWKDFFFTDAGWLTKKGGDVLFWGGLVLMLLPLYLMLEGYVSVVVVGIPMGLGAAMTAATGYEGQAKKFGFQPPFTEDPLGWRKAKRTYPGATVTRLHESDDVESTAPTPIAIPASGATDALRPCGSPASAASDTSQSPDCTVRPR